MVMRGYSDDQIQAILGRNLLCVLWANQPAETPCPAELQQVDHEFVAERVDHEEQRKAHDVPGGMA